MYIYILYIYYIYILCVYIYIGFLSLPCLMAGWDVSLFEIPNMCKKIQTPGVWVGMFQPFLPYTHHDCSASIKHGCSQSNVGILVQMQGLARTQRNLSCLGEALQKMVMSMYGGFLEWGDPQLSSMPNFGLSIRNHHFWVILVVHPTYLGRLSPQVRVD